MTVRRSPLRAVRRGGRSRLGFGHLVRCGVLADALGVRRELVASRTVTRRASPALRLGWTVHQGPTLERALSPI